MRKNKKEERVPRSFKERIFHCWADSEFRGKFQDFLSELGENETFFPGGVPVTLWRTPFFSKLARVKPLPIARNISSKEGGATTRFMIKFLPGISENQIGYNHLLLCEWIYSKAKSEKGELAASFHEREMLELALVPASRNIDTQFYANTLLEDLVSSYRYRIYDGERGTVQFSLFERMDRDEGGNCRVAFSPEMHFLKFFDYSFPYKEYFDSIMAVSVSGSKESGGARPLVSIGFGVRCAFASLLGVGKRKSRVKKRNAIGFQSIVSNLENPLVRELENNLDDRIFFAGEVEKALEVFWDRQARAFVFNEEGPVAIEPPFSVSKFITGEIEKEMGERAAGDSTERKEKEGGQPQQGWSSGRRDIERIPPRLRQIAKALRQRPEKSLKAYQDLLRSVKEKMDLEEDEVYSMMEEYRKVIEGIERNLKSKSVIGEDLIDLDEEEEELERKCVELEKLWCDHLKARGASVGSDTPNLGGWYNIVNSKEMTQISINAGIDKERGIEEFDRFKNWNSARRKYNTNWVKQYKKWIDTTISWEKASKRKKAKIKAEDIEWSEEAREIALELGFSPEKAEVVFLKFKAYHSGKGTTFAKWEEGWKFWLLNEIEFSQKGKASSANPLEATVSEKYYVSKLVSDEIVAMLEKEGITPAQIVSGEVEVEDITFETYQVPKAYGRGRETLFRWRDPKVQKIFEEKYTNGNTGASNGRMGANQVDPGPEKREDREAIEVQLIEIKE